MTELIITARYCHYPHRFDAVEEARERGHRDPAFLLLMKEVQRINRILDWITNDEELFNTLINEIINLYKKAKELGFKAWLYLNPNYLDNIVFIQYYNDFIIGITYSPHDDDIVLHCFYIHFNKSIQGNITPFLLKYAYDKLCNESVIFDVQYGLWEVIINPQNNTTDIREVYKEDDL